MATIQFTAKVRDSRLLELPEEARALGLKPGDEVKVSLDQNGTEQAAPRNEKMLAILREIQERQKDRPYTSGEDTLRLLHEARAGAMYGYDPTE